MKDYIHIIAVTIIAVSLILSMAFSPNNPNFATMATFVGIIITQILTSKQTESVVKTQVKEGTQETVKSVAVVHDLVNSQSDMLRKSEKIVSEAVGYDKAIHEQEVSDAAKATGHAEGVAAEQSDQKFRDEGVKS